VCVCVCVSECFVGVEKQRASIHSHTRIPPPPPMLSWPLIVQVDFSDSLRLVIDFSCAMVALGEDTSQAAALTHYTFDSVASSAA
jgi:hypothetical protein